MADERIVHVRKPWEPAFVSGEHCPFGCYDLCHRPELCTTPPAARTPAEKREVDAFPLDLERSVEQDLATMAEADAMREPVPEERAAYDALIRRVHPAQQRQD